MLEELKLIDSEYCVAYKKYHNFVREHLDSVLDEEIFNKFPHVESLAFDADTPFNDGDAVVYRAYIEKDEVHINDADIYDIDEGDEEAIKKHEEVAAIFSNILSVIDFDILERVYDIGWTTFHRKEKNENS